jgi:hypothetical protein
VATAKKKYYKLSLPLTISPSTESWMRPYGNPPEATNFIMFQPDNGRTIPEKKTIVKVIYDNDAIYVAALLYDDEPDKIRKEISQRDSFGISDVLAFYQWL